VATPSLSDSNVESVNLQPITHLSEDMVGLTGQWEMAEAAEAPSGSGSDGAQETAEIEREARALSVQQAHSDGRLGFGLSAGGFLFPYHLGALWELERLGLAAAGRGSAGMAGASAGALAIATFNCGISERDAKEALRTFAEECRSGGTSGRLSKCIRCAPVLFMFVLYCCFAQLTNTAKAPTPRNI
jgi:hypothetical protein